MNSKTTLCYMSPLSHRIVRYTGNKLSCYDNKYVGLDNDRDDMLPPACVTNLLQPTSIALKRFHAVFRAGLTTRLTRLQPRAPTAQGVPRELRDSHSPGCTFNLATLKIDAVLL